MCLIQCIEFDLISCLPLTICGLCADKSGGWNAEIGRQAPPAVLCLHSEEASGMFFETKIGSVTAGQELRAKPGQNNASGHARLTGMWPLL